MFNLTNFIKSFIKSVVLFFFDIEIFEEIKNLETFNEEVETCNKESIFENEYISMKDKLEDRRSHWLAKLDETLFPKTQFYENSTSHLNQKLEKVSKEVSWKEFKKNNDQVNNYFRGNYPEPIKENTIPFPLIRKIS